MCALVWVPELFVRIGITMGRDCLDNEVLRPGRPTRLTTGIAFGH